MTEICIVEPQGVKMGKSRVRNKLRLPPPSRDRIKLCVPPLLI